MNYIYSNSSNVGFPYFSVEINGESVTWAKSEKAPNYFTQLTNKRYTSQANVTEVRLRYVPGQDDNDIHKLEEMLLSTAEGKPCYYTYGRHLASLYRFRGLIVNYKITFNQGYLDYTLSIVSESTMSSMNTIKEEMLNIPDPSNTWAYHNWRVNLVQALLEAEYGYTEEDRLNYDIDSRYDEMWSRIAEREDFEGFNVNDIFDEFTYIINNYLCDSSGKPFYRFDVENSVKDFVWSSGDLRVDSSAPLTAMSNICKFLVSKDESQRNTSFYVLIIDEAGTSVGEGTIRLAKTDSSQPPDAQFKFKYGTKNSEVLSWSADFNGGPIVAASKYKALDNIVISDETGISNIEIAMPPLIDSVNSGEISADDFVEAGWSAGDAAAVLQNRRQAFLKHANYPYTASMTILGQDPGVLELMKTIEVFPYVGNQLHHTHGIYLITGIEDSVNDSQGFTTTLKLTKRASKDDIIDYSLFGINMEEAAISSPDATRQTRVGMAKHHEYYVDVTGNQDQVY